MKRRDFVSLSIVVLAVAACGKKPKLSSLPAGSRVLAFGDSVTFGTVAGPGEDWPTLLAGLTGWQITNAGIPGDTAEAGKTRIRGLLDEHTPALVIIEIGGNDFLRRRPASAVKQDIKFLIGTAKGAGAQIVLIGVPELSVLAVVAGKPGDAPIYKELGNEEGVSVIANVFSDILARPELCADKIHPNAQGYRQMASGIHAGLRRIGLAH
ncbi:MAG: arylesterase [Dechloromonas sp.]|uniref:Arylesterase n=1 Tax=Candidatus Dechloromonas phosphorivorans TaxID=2899244 RepID=A0A935K6D2_9RHOO|nr:arylesterase [Candidatus Dechloromonas phosphorivorans]